MLRQRPFTVAQIYGVLKYNIDAKARAWQGDIELGVRAREEYDAIYKEIADFERAIAVNRHDPEMREYEDLVADKHHEAAGIEKKIIAARRAQANLNSLAGFYRRHHQITFVQPRLNQLSDLRSQIESKIDRVENNISACEINLELDSGNIDAATDIRAYSREYSELQTQLNSVMSEIRELRHAR